MDNGVADVGRAGDVRRAADRGHAVRAYCEPATAGESIAVGGVMCGPFRSAPAPTEGPGKHWSNVSIKDMEQPPALDGEDVPAQLEVVGDSFIVDVKADNIG